MSLVFNQIFLPSSNNIKAGGKVSLPKLFVSCQYYLEIGGWRKEKSFKHEKEIFLLEKVKNFVSRDLHQKLVLAGAAFTYKITHQLIFSN